MQRRNFLKTLGGTPLVGLAPYLKNKTIIKPARLKVGDTIGLVCPAAPAYSKEKVKILVESMEALGLKVKFGKHIWERYGYLAGRDAERAADINDFFKDTSISGIVCMHGGWGCARLLPYLDYDLIRQNPKVIIGYSDITALLLGIHSQTGLVTFHGPEGAATWNTFTVDYFKSVLMKAEATLFKNPSIIGDNLTVVKDRINTLYEGMATGRLLGGNLTVLCHLIGSNYLPDWTDAVFFCEDVDEAPYSMDRMITHLKLSGILEKINGFVFGKCTECYPSSGEYSYGSLTLEDVWEDHIRPLRKPAFSGAMIGHISHKFTIPIGINASIDANLGTIQLSESAVV
jgi:muramoyltetrapeptide carboxypeptidase